MVDIAAEYFPQSALNRDSYFVAAWIEPRVVSRFEIMPVVMWYLHTGGTRINRGHVSLWPRVADQRKFWKSESYFSSDGPAPGGNGGSSLNSGHTPKSARCPDSAFLRRNRPIAANASRRRHSVWFASPASPNLISVGPLIGVERLPSLQDWHEQAVIKWQVKFAARKKTGSSPNF